MATKTTADTTAADQANDLALPTGGRITLGATSYDFNALHDAACHAGTLKTEDGRDKALAKAEHDARLAPLPGNETPLPPGTKIETVEDANGNEVEAPVNDPDNQPADPAAGTDATDAA